MANLIAQILVPFIDEDSPDFRKNVPDLGQENFPQDRLTDHRVNYTRHNLAAVMDGDVQDVVDACRTFFSAQALREASRPVGDGRGPEKRA